MASNSSSGALAETASGSRPSWSTSPSPTRLSELKVPGTWGTPPRLAPAPSCINKRSTERKRRPAICGALLLALSQQESVASESSAASTASPCSLGPSAFPHSPPPKALPQAVGQLFRRQLPLLMLPGFTLSVPYTRSSIEGTSIVPSHRNALSRSESTCPEAAG
jgi:hypothetical protein